MGPGDGLDLLQSIGIYLTRIRERKDTGELSNRLDKAAAQRSVSPNLERVARL